jgi:hypothetical protein
VTNDNDNFSTTLLNLCNTRTCRRNKSQVTHSKH